MVVKGQKKRQAQPLQGPAKKRKIASTSEKHPKSKGKGKEKAVVNKDYIPIPTGLAEDEIDLSDQDLEFFEEFGGSAGFLTSLDEKGIAKSKKEIERLHQLHKPVRPKIKDDLPSIDSGDEGSEDEWSSGVEIEDDELSIPNSEDDDSDASASSSSSSGHLRRRKAADSDSDAEMAYEAQPRKRRPGWESDSDKDQGIERLPIKLADGRIQKTNTKVYLPKEDKNEPSGDESSNDERELSPPRPVIEDVSTGARFGRPAVADVIGHKSRKTRVQLAKEQIASICQEIVSDPENSLGLLRRLHTFSLAEISTPTHPEPIPNDPVIRKLTFLSQLAVFKDIIPGYRIRALTDKEKAEKVSQQVQRTRDWEQGLVSVYQSYLKTLDVEVKAKNELSDVALKCMCTLLTDVTHFNFRVNLMSTIVACLSRKSWDKNSDLCLNSIIKVFRADLTGIASLETVRLLNRMIKERRFNIHPEVLSCLLTLRLKTELGVRASETRADKADDSNGKKFTKGRAAARRAKGKATDQPYLSKKARKVQKERQEIAKEMREAVAEVDKEERDSNHTETLKLLFVLYFRILKNPRPTPLLPAALRGISKFAHLVNVDFFKDLLKVLKELMHRKSETEDEFTSTGSEPAEIQEIQHQLLCIVTAFELLSGQGEALDIDLSDFINGLYAMIPLLSLMSHIETAPSSKFQADVRVSKSLSTSEMLFRALQLAFSPRASVAASPPWRSAAFAKRLLTASMHWPPATVVRAIDFVTGLVERDSKLEALLSTDDRSVNGVYRPDLDDPQLSNPFGTCFWELLLLSQQHWNSSVRVAAKKLLDYSPAS
ncbi:hypothetical protein QCA50_003159 [Cerrena zonata]|uniref:Nucleolar complex-associated protein 3 n=1 Tax=Cerrena zonata TaxID=2478898 RepID=A0AAW0GRB7_9APHY